MNERPREPSDRPADAERQATFVLTRFEKWALPRMAAALPRWVMPDHLTGIGVFGATLVAAAYLSTRWSPAWLWVANLGLLINWFGDSLDGTLARVRKHERPRYGFYLDHLTDAYSTTAIGIGLGFSPYMLLSTGLAIVIAYLTLSINVYLETHVFKVFRFGYGIVGPTEARLLLLGLNLVALVIGPLDFGIKGVGFTVFDVVGIAAALGMLSLLATRAGRNLRDLGRLEPPGTPRRD
ncbi:MAG: CDP-alcohol phosphatidyltransferase family protein [Candidatus Eisenbacteria bacterium]